MKFNLSMRIRVFVIAVFVIVIGQLFYSNKNVTSFQESYLETLSDKCEKMGGFLKDDVEYVLNLNIPITKLIKLEKTLSVILKSTPELAFIEITDLSNYVLYYADHQTMKRVDPGTKKSSTLDVTANTALEDLGLTSKDVDTVLPVYYKRMNRHVGYIKMRLSPDLVVSQSRQIMLDMITVILTSLLITFEFLTFFAAFSISDPLEKVTTDINRSAFKLNPVSGKSFIFMSELGDVVERFNKFMEKLLDTIRPYISMQHYFPAIRRKLLNSIVRQKRLMDNCVGGKEAEEDSEFQRSISRMRNRIMGLGRKMDDFAIHLSPQVFTYRPDEKRYSQRLDRTSRIPYAYIRPLIFLFVMADGFCVSFFPMFVDTLYQPLWGLSKEVIIGLPISVFMLFFAISMPITGTLSDTIGWRRPLLIGTFINAVGLILTALSTTIFQLLMYRAITAVGFGIVFMSCQRFVFDNTSLKKRTLGMASFLAAFFSGDICGTVVGGMLADRIGYTNVFLVSGFCSMVAFVVGVTLFRGDPRADAPPKRKPEAGKAKFSISNMFSIFSDREFAAIVFLQAIPAKLVLVGFLYYFVPLYLRSIGTLQSDIGRVLMCYAVALVFLGPPFSKYVDKAAYRKYYVFTGGLITGLSMVSFYFMGGFLHLLVLVFMLGVAHTFSVSSQVSMITETGIEGNTAYLTSEGMDLLEIENGREVYVWQIP